MGIVVVTIPGAAQREFVNRLHLKTEGVDLVIIQKRKPLSWRARLAQLYRDGGVLGCIKELWYGFLLRADARSRRALEYFRTATLAPAATREYLPRTLEVESVNSAEAYAALSAFQPELLVVWGSEILKPHMVAIARRAINLHFGYCPDYRGALANQHAISRGDTAHIGATIHYINGHADAGDVLALIAGDPAKSPRELFRELNDTARARFLEIATRLHRGEALPARRQPEGVSNVMLLREWKPSARYRVGKKVLAWEQSHRKAQHARARKNAAQHALPYFPSAIFLAPVLLADVCALGV